MPKNVMKMLKPSPNYGRNDFDLSHRTVHSANFGELIPTFCIETLPKDKISCRVSDLVRAQPMVTSPFLRAKQHLDVWFVPYNLMWSRFNEFLVDKDEPGSSSLNDRLYVPQITTDNLYTAIDKFETNCADIHNVVSIDSVNRNLDLLGYGGSLLYKEIHAGTQNYPSLSVNLWRLLAYNLIWYREYRQQYYDDGKYLLPNSISTLSNGATYLFNMDALKCDTVADSNLVSGLSAGADILTAMLQPRYRCWKKDIYTGLMPNSQFGNVSVVPLSQVLISGVTGDDINRWSPVGSDAQGSSDGSVSTGTNSWYTTRKNIIQSQGGTYVDLKHDHSFSATISGNGFDILTLRKKEAVQRWRENALRAGNQVEDNFEAHFGVKPKSHMKLHPQHVASFDAPLNIGDINSQAQTGQVVNGELGDVAGKGIMSFDNCHFEFETNDYGVLMAIYSVLPEAEYNGNNLDRMNALLEREDYFFPEYENLGLELVDSTVISMNSQQNFGLGYAPRYFGYKQKHDRCVGDFMQYQGFNGQFRHWCSPKYDVDSAINAGSLPLSTLYVNPNVFNVNFAIDWKVTPQFLVDMYCDCAAIRQMSVSGMPGY